MWNNNRGTGWGARRPQYNQNQNFGGQSWKPDYNQGGGYSKPAKRSGCHQGKTSQGERAGMPFYSGWNVSKKGFVSFVAVPAREPNHSINKHGELNPLKAGWERWVVTLEIKENGTYKKSKETLTGFLKTSNGKLYMPDLTMVANPQKDYFGTCKKPTNNRR